MNLAETRFRASHQFWGQGLERLPNSSSPLPGFSVGKRGRQPASLTVPDAPSTPRPSVVVLPQPPRDTRNGPERGFNG
jgi:hypothetical protein